MPGMENGMVLLSSRERKAMFRAVQLVEANDLYIPEHRRQDLLDGLDDGGIWNPCFLVMPNGFDAAVGLLISMRSAGREYPEFEHTYTVLKDRMLYVKKRREEAKKRGPRWPFAKKEGYYGPNWDQARERAIERDGEQCVRCGIGREEHQERFDQDLHVHHLDSIRECETYDEANRLENLETLCFKCHAQTEHQSHASNPG